MKLFLEIDCDKLDINGLSAIFEKLALEIIAQGKDRKFDCRHIIFDLHHMPIGYYLLLINPHYINLWEG